MVSILNIFGRANAEPSRVADVQTRIPVPPQKTKQDSERDVLSFGDICESHTQLRTGMATNPFPCAETTLFPALHKQQDPTQDKAVLGGQEVHIRKQEEMPGMGVQGRAALLVHQRNDL